MRNEFGFAVLISFIFMSLGFLLLHFELVGYGISFFVFLPFTIGYILGKSIVKKISLYGLIFSTITFFILLLVGGLEGMICILFSLPIVIVATILGIGVKRLIDKGNQKQDNLLKSTVLPFLLFFGFGVFEKFIAGNNKEIISVKSEMIVPYATMKVYDAIKSVDTLIAEKPFLMKLDLPIPTKCILEKEEVGGLRTCYFSGGTITEKITELEKAKVIRMDVIDYRLTGRKWLGFEEAIYWFDEVGKDSCKLTRVTTYTSVLAPRFYWKPLEQLGIRQEHEYVFDNLKNDLRRNARK